MNQQLQPHKAFNLMSVVEKLPFQIECLACYNNTLIVGLYTGQILVYTMTYNHQSLKLDVNLDRSVKSITKKPIQQLEIIPSYSLIIALFDSQVHVLDMNTYQHKYTLQRSKGALLFATSSSSSNQQLINLCIACRRKLQFFYLNNKNIQFMDLINDLDLPDTPKTLEFSKDNLVLFSLRKDYCLYELPTLFKPSASAASQTGQQQQQTYKEVFNIGARTLDPLCYKMNYAPNFALCREENKTIILDSRGVPELGYPIVWSSTPALLCNVGPYLIGLLTGTNSLEVLCFEPKSVSIQQIEFQSGSASGSTGLSSSFTASGLSSTPTSFLSSTVGQLQSMASAVTSTSTGNPDRVKILSNSTNSVCYVATQNNVWCLVPISINDQLENLIRTRNYELAINLIEAYNSYQKLQQQNKPQRENEPTPASPQVSPFLSKDIFQVVINQDLIMKINNLNALDLYCQKKFEESMKQFELLPTDPQYVIAFIPGLLPDNHRTQLINYKDVRLPELTNAQEIKLAIDSLIDYLQYKRKEFLKDEPVKQNSNNDNAASNLQLYSLTEHKFIQKKRKMTLEIIDTTLLQCYLRTREQLVQNLLRREQNYFHLETSERLLKAHKKYNELIILYEKKQLHERALNLMLGESKNHDSQLFGLQHMVKYMKKLGNENLKLILKYAKDILEKDATLGIEIFIDPTVTVDDNRFTKPKANGTTAASAVNTNQNDDEDELLSNLNREEICEFFKTQIEPFELSIDLLLRYLEYCVYIWLDNSEYINNLLIQIYKVHIEKLDRKIASTTLALDIDKSSRQRLKDKLVKFLSESKSYDINTALSQFDLDSEERAILLGKMGQHEEALRIYVEKLNDTNKAEAYCKNVFSNPSTFVNSQNVYYQLLKMYLNSDNDDIRINYSAKLLNQHSNEIASCQTLEMLPAESIKCTNLTQFFENMLDRIVKSRRHNQILKYLTFSLNLQVHELRIVKQQTKFTVTEEKMCKICNKRLGKSAIVRYPDGTIMHYGCCRNSNVFN